MRLAVVTESRSEEKQQEFIKRLETLALRVLNLVRCLPKTPENRVYGTQVIKSSSSVGANYTEATCAISRNDFTNDLNRARKESKESTFWLRLIAKANPKFQKRMEDLLKESEEICKILSRSVKTSKSKTKPKL